MRRLSIVCVLFVAGCPSPPPPGQDAGPPDLTVPRPPDLAMPDMAVPPDLLAIDVAKPPGLCAGTAIAGTCVDDFFTVAGRCFPISGACTYSYAAYMVYSTCWESGSKRIESGGQGQVQARWSNGNGVSCMIGQQVNNGWIYFAGNQNMNLDFNDRFTCPNGISVKVPYGTCPALDQLLGLRGPPQGCQSVMGPGC